MMSLIEAIALAAEAVIAERPGLPKTGIFKAMLTVSTGWVIEQSMTQSQISELLARDDIKERLFEAAESALTSPAMLRAMQVA
jgi:hypothetical protein